MLIRVSVCCAALAFLGCKPKTDSVAQSVAPTNQGVIEPKLKFGKKQGNPIASIPVGALSNSPDLKSVRVFEPYEQQEVEFRGLPLPSVLNQAYGPTWKDAEEVLFNCLDGYKATIPISRLLNYRAWLALRRPGDQGFSILKFEEGKRKRIDLSPAYVIWENLHDEHLRNEGDYGWPYQVVSVDLVSTESQFQRMTPPPNASPLVQKGFANFRANCTSCHAINGQGGQIGPELNYPANPTEYLKPEWLVRWISNPSSMRTAPRMPPLNPQLQERDQVIRSLVAYLSEMAKHKLPPAPAQP